MYRLLETIRIENGSARWVEYHQRRVDRSIGLHSKCNVSLQHYIHSIDLPKIGCHKLRIIYCQDGIVEHTIYSYLPRPINSLQLVVDNHITYDQKAEDRSAIEHLVTLRNECDDILIIRDGLITDSSFANITLLDGGQWVTPTKPLLAGTCRERLIESGQIIPRHITYQSLINHQKLLLINSMLDFDPSRAIPISSVRL